MSSNQQPPKDEPGPEPDKNALDKFTDRTQPASLENIPANSPAITSIEIQTELPPMEVHHHGHVHADKKWKEYLFQFLMLFLAITTGFFVENQREHYVEHKRAKEFARLLVDDLISDTSELNLAQRAWTNIVIASDSLSALIQPTNTNIPGGKIYFYGYWSAWRWNVISRDATLQQLKSSGAMRYFGDVSLIRKILHYEEAIKLTYLLQNRFDSEKSVNWQVVQNVFDQSYFDTLEAINGAARSRTANLSKPNPALTDFLKKNIPLNTYDKPILNALKNGAENTSRNYHLLLRDIIDTKLKAIEAIEALKSEYDLD